MVVYTFELLPEGGYAPTGVFRGKVKVDRPFPIDIDLPEVTWLPAAAALGPAGSDTVSRANDGGGRVPRPR